MAFFENFLALFIESAPYLLFGMGIAGLLHEIIPSNRIQQWLGGRFAIVKAALIGTPLPLCSCSVIPVAMGIRRSGASRASTTSFMIATPETGVDSISITYALMGPVMAIVRPIAAITTAISAGLAVQLFAKEEQATVTAQKPQSSCCHKTDTSKQQNNWPQKLQSAIRYGYGKLLGDFMQWLLIGLFFAALVQTFVPASYLAEFGDSLWAMLLVVLLSIPMYICATASTPIAVGLLMSGVSPGAALVFMLAGPATNIATLAVVKQELGSRALTCYLSSVIGIAILCGLGLDALFQHFQWQLDLQMGQHGEMQGLFYQACALVLAVLMIKQFGQQWLASRQPKSCH